ARYDVDCWERLLLPWHRWLRRWGLLSRPGPNDGNGNELTPTFTARGLRRLFTPFVEHRVHKRQLRRSEVPHVWRWLPLPLLERLMGRVLVLKAFKPLSAAMAMQMAA